MHIFLQLVLEMDLFEILETKQQRRAIQFIVI